MLAHFAGARFLIFPRKRNVVMQSQALNCKGRSHVYRNI